jgi:hypothetical protein
MGAESKQPMTETRTCIRCARVGTQSFRRTSNPRTGAIEWQCAAAAACGERQARQPPPEGTESVTSWAAKRRHLAIPGSDYTLCHTRAVRPGGIHIRDHITPMTTDLINSMRWCEHCARTTKPRHPQGHS